MVCVSEREMRQTDDRMKERKKEYNNKERHEREPERHAVAETFCVLPLCSSNVCDASKICCVLYAKMKTENRKTNLQNLGTLLK